LYGSYTEVGFQKAYQKALQMQKESPLPYGPFVYNGTNCSRFVYTVILAGKPQMKHALKIKYKVPLTPTPMSNVIALPYKMRISAKQPWELFYPGKKPEKSELSGTLLPPGLNGKVPSQAQWHSGEGAGSWFHIEKRNDKHFLVTRYSPEGIMECKSVFCNDAAVDFDPALPFELVHLSHCAQVKLTQNEQRITLTRIAEAVSNWREIPVPKVEHELPAW
jgi:hypothetical protein